MKDKELARQGILFILVGGVNTVIDLVIFRVLTGFGVAGVIAKFFSYGTGVVCSLFLNSRFTFRQKSPLRGRQVAMFLAVNLVAYAVSAALIWFYDHHTGVPSLGEGYTLLGIPLSKVPWDNLFSMPFALIVNFIGNRLFVFKQKQA